MCLFQHFFIERQRSSSFQTRSRIYAGVNYVRPEYRVFIASDRMDDQRCGSLTCHSDLVAVVVVLCWPLCDYRISFVVEQDVYPMWEYANTGNQARFNVLPC